MNRGPLGKPQFEGEDRLRIHDISITVTETIPTWPGDPAVSLQRAHAISRGDAANVSRLEAGVHTGTHIDAPVHFIDGARGIDSLPLEALVGPCLVVAANPPGTTLRPEDLPPTAARRILFKTRNSRHWAAGEANFDEDFVAVGLELAAELIRRGVQLVGVDYLSVEEFRAPFEHPVHRSLLEAGIVVLEGCNLSAVEPGEYRLCALPVKLGGSDGAPARAILIEDEPESGHNQ